MAYKELIKNFDRIRDYMREFYVYGFRSRDEFDRKSARSYDDERRRIESWLKDYMGFRHTSEGKNIFISIDSRETVHNPLYNAWKAKSFTDGDITLHFIIFDILHSPDICLSFSQITEITERDYLSQFSDHRVFDESTVRKKLKEYCECGMIISEKQGRSVVYRRAADPEHISTDVLDFFSEVAPCGVIGSFLLDREEEHSELFAFKHHYIVNRLEREKRCGNIEIISEGKCRFSADVFDVSEMIPWIRTFICRITDLSFSDKEAEKRFRDDLELVIRVLPFGPLIKITGPDEFTELIKERLRKQRSLTM